MKPLMDRERLNEATRVVLGCAFKVGNTLGHGFLEKVYENALAIELREAGHTVMQQGHFGVLYRGRVVGEYCPDMIVDGGVVIEIKALDDLADRHRSQCINYLRVTGLPVALLLNFGRPRVQYQRIVLDL